MDEKTFSVLQPLLQEVKYGMAALIYAQKEWLKGNRKKEIKDILLLYMSRDELKEL